MTKAKTAKPLISADWRAEILAPEKGATTGATPPAAKAPAKAAPVATGGQQTPISSAPVALAPPPGLSPADLRRWYVEQQIGSVRAALALAESEVNRGNQSALGRLGSLNRELRSWLEALAELEPKEEKDLDEERRHAAAASSVLRKIEGGVEATERRYRAHPTGTA